MTKSPASTHRAERSLPGIEAVMSTCNNGPVEERVLAAWRVWLSALATDPEAAFAAALAYQALDDEGRVLWLDALDQDAPKLAVPKMAIYAPLLAVETDPGRRSRMEDALKTCASTGSARTRGRALRGVARNGELLMSFVLPLYLDFVQAVACRGCLERGFLWLKRDPILHERDAPLAGSMLEGVRMEAVPLKLGAEDLARTILAHRRSARPLPDELQSFVSLFDSRALEE